jgi:hypothetical protein
MQTWVVSFIPTRFDVGVLTTTTSSLRPSCSSSIVGNFPAELVVEFDEAVSGAEEDGGESEADVGR